MMRIRIRDLLDPGSGMKTFSSGIRKKRPGSATLEKCIKTVSRVGISAEKTSGFSLIYIFSFSIIQCKR